jgi:hypothetical protein
MSRSLEADMRADAKASQRRRWEVGPTQELTGGIPPCGKEVEKASCLVP